MKKQRKRGVGWWITEQGERWFKEQEEERQRLEDTHEHARIIPLYSIPGRKDGKPSINTAEGWEALRQRLMKESGVSNEPYISFVSKDVDKVPLMGYNASIKTDERQH